MQLTIDFNFIKVYINYIKVFKFMQEVIHMNKLPEWIENLDEEDINFIKKFILSSGSLKEVAALYGVTYPTVRLRLDKLIQKIKLNESKTNEPYILLIKKLALEDKLDFDTAKILISEYKNLKKEVK
jgi:hypothetical protein